MDSRLKMSGMTTWEGAGMTRGGCGNDDLGEEMMTGASGHTPPASLPLLSFRTSFMRNPSGRFQDEDGFPIKNVGNDDLGRCGNDEGRVRE